MSSESVQLKKEIFERLYVFEVETYLRMINLEFQDLN
jgi:hypothetical protein